MMLIRHAQSAWNAAFSRTRVDPMIEDPSLTEFGRSQAEGLIETLRDAGLKRLVASPYRRTLETATLLAEGLDLAIDVEPLVRERCYFSCDIGSQPVVLQKVFPDVRLGDLEPGWWGVPPESEEQLAVRCADFRDKIHNVTDMRDVAVISHWGFIRAFTGQEVDNAACIRCPEDMLSPLASPAT